eukprot:gene100-134_t
MILRSKALYHHLYQRLLTVTSDVTACRALVLRILDHYFQLDSRALIMDDLLPSPLPVDIFEEVIERLRLHEPIQYILGAAFFMDRKFMVNAAVLIPRPETEELVQLILKENSVPNLQILDLCTGSGCIAITLAKEIPHAHVTGLDISEAALKVAQLNAQQLGAEVHWLQADILQDPLPHQKWDIIVSNPPYVRQSEKKFMHPRVVDYEPEQAIFVQDEAPLIFYDRIIQLATTHLQPGGKLYVEINEKFGHVLVDKLREHKFQHMGIGCDMNGKDRWVHAQRSGY